MVIKNQSYLSSTTCDNLAAWAKWFFNEDHHVNVMLISEGVSAGHKTRLHMLLRHKGVLETLVTESDRDFVSSSFQYSSILDKMKSKLHSLVVVVVQLIQPMERNTDIRCVIAGWANT
jgi:hypothetical protein